jgi:hypothetical protein
MGEETLSIKFSCSGCGDRLPIENFGLEKRTARKLPPRRRDCCKRCRAKDERLRRQTPEWIEGRRLKKATDKRWRAAEIFGRLKKRSKLEGYEFDLTPAWVYERLCAGRCELTGLGLDLSASFGPYSPSIDRVISGSGYTQRNCRMILWCLNSALGTWGLEAFLPVAKALIR